MPFTESFIASPLGTLKCIGDGRSIVAIEYAPSHKPLPSGDPLLKHCQKQLDEYFASKRTEFSVPLKPRGTLFQLAVWRAIERIPYVETRTYAEIAKQSNYPKAARAVGSACGSNPIVILIPCHRVVGSNGLGGYSGGIKRKKWLLEHEKSDLKKNTAT